MRLRRVLALNLGIAALIGWGLTGELLRSRGMDREVARLNEQVETLEARNVELSRAADRLSGSAMLEREARLKLNMRRPGESVVVVQGGEFGGPQAVGRNEPDRAAGQVAGESVSNYHKWIRYLFPHE